jgi:hypothetical protein
VRVFRLYRVIDGETWWFDLVAVGRQSLDDLVRLTHERTTEMYREFCEREAADAE